MKANPIDATKTSNRLKRSYKVALASIAVLTILSSSLLILTLHKQESYSRVINISGRQRMLSQNLVKNFLILSRAENVNDYESLSELKENLKAWERGHHALQFGDTALGVPRRKLSDKVSQQFRQIQPSYDSMREAFAVVTSIDRPGYTGELMTQSLKKALNNERSFLKQMDQITFELDLSAKREIEKLKKYEIIVLISTLTVLLLEGLFIFRPIAKLVGETIFNYKSANQKLERFIEKDKESQKIILKERENKIASIIFTQEAERRRIAADLHDGIGQMLSSLRINLSVVQDKMSKCDDEKFDGILDPIKKSIEDITTEIRNVSYNLSPPTLKMFGLAYAIEEELKKLSANSKVTLLYNKLIKEKPFKPKLEIVLYRSFQEIIKNALEHAQASEVIVQLIQHKKYLVLLIEDNGCGFDLDEALARNNSSGLKNLFARIEVVRGELTIDSRLNSGTTVTIKVPIS